MRKMFFRLRKLVVAVSVLALLCGGCGTVRDAREAQADVAPKSAEGSRAVALAPVRLHGQSLRALVDFALTNRPAIVKAQLAVRDARLALKEIAADAPIASATPWGGVDAGISGGYGENSRSAHFSDLKAKTVRGDPSATLSVNLLLWDFGRNAARARAQTERVLAAELALIDQGYTVFQEVAEQYFSMRECDALLTVATTNVALRTEQVERAKVRHEHGLALELDVLRAELDLTEAQEECVVASNNVAVAEAKLMAALGIDVSQGSARDVLGARAGTLDAVYRAFPDSFATAEDVFLFAGTNAPAMKIARAEVRAMSAQVDAALADLLPEVSASVSLNWTDPLWYWRWGVDAAQSLFSGWRKTTAVDRAVVSMKSAAAALDGAEQKLSADIRLAVTRRDNAREFRRTVRASLKEVRTNLEVVRAQYAVGDASRVDCTEAITDYVEALGNRVSAFYRTQLAEANLFHLAGCDPIYDEERIPEEH